MKRFEHACIVIGSALIALGLVVAFLLNEAQREKKEQDRRNEMYR